MFVEHVIIANCNPRLIEDVKRFADRVIIGTTIRNGATVPNGILHMVFPERWRRIVKARLHPFDRRD